MFAEQSALPYPQPGLPATLLPMEEGPGMRVRSLVVLVPRLRAALERLNPTLPPKAITAGGLIEWLEVGCRKSFLSSRFLFE